VDLEAYLGDGRGRLFSKLPTEVTLKQFVSGFRDIALEQGINAVRGLLNVVEKAVEEEAREMM